MKENTLEAALLSMYRANLDWAQTQNGIGYNKLDTEFGNSLGERVMSGRPLSAKQAMAGYKLLRKYKAQLRAVHGIDYDSIPDPATEERFTAPKPKVRRELQLDPESKTPQVLIRSEYNTDILARTRSLPQRVWDAGRKVWLAGLTLDNIPAVQALAADFGFEVDPEAARIMEEAAARHQANITASSALDAELDIPDLGGTLLPFQRAGVKFTLDNLDTGGVLIADEMGLGKTVQALAVLQSRSAFPALVVVPKVVWLNWAKECRRWLPGRKVALLASKSAPRRLDKLAPCPVIRQGVDELVDADVYILNYDILTRWQADLAARTWEAVVFDESHLLKERKAKRTIAAKELAANITVRLMLTGTPVPNRPAELITQLYILDRMQVFGGFRRYWYRFCEGYQDGARDLDVLNDTMRSAFYVRRRKLDVMPELPPVRWDSTPVELEDYEAYEKVEEDLYHWFVAKLEEDADFQAELAKLPEEERPAAISARAATAAWRARGAEALVQIEALKQTAARLKLRSVKDWVDAFLEATRTNGTGNKIILYTHHRVVGQALAAEYEAPFIWGGVDTATKAAAEQRFQNDPHCRVIVCSIEAAGLGITLTAASDVAFVELPWRPMDLDQAVARAYGRVNDPHGVNAYQLVAPGTIEERIVELIERKRVRVDMAQDGKAEETSVLSDLLGQLWAEAAGGR